MEQIPDFAKSLVWQKDYEALKNQYHIAQQQFRMIELLDGQVQYLVTECSLPQILYYNEHHPDNICDIQKTKAQILAWYKQYNNINVVVERGDKKYVHTGRFQDGEQAREVDRGMRAILRRDGIVFAPLKPELEAINAFAATLIA